MDQARHLYGERFFAEQVEGSLRSARIVLPLLHAAVPIASVLDVGCGLGTWLKAHQDFGVTDILGLDGDYVAPGALLIEADRFRPLDISRPFDLGRRFDLVQCLEVAEHLPASAAAQLVESLTGHGEVVLFSAAVPGQGGEHHINEQPLEYWRRLFRARGYRPFDLLRPQVLGNPEVEPWYRFNTLVYVAAAAAEALPSGLRERRIGDCQRIPEFAPFKARLRRSLRRVLPDAAVEGLAGLKRAVAG